MYQALALVATDSATIHDNGLALQIFLYRIEILPLGKRHDGLLRTAETMFANLFAQRILAFDALAARSFPVIAASRRRHGRPISIFDAQIVAIAHVNDATFPTRNTADFAGCGLRLAKPWRDLVVSHETLLRRRRRKTCHSERCRAESSTAGAAASTDPYSPRTAYHLSNNSTYLALTHSLRQAASTQAVPSSHPSLVNSSFSFLLPEVVMRARLLALTTLAMFLSPCFFLPWLAQAKHPFTFEDMMKLKRVGEPVPSPDGKWVLFSAVDVDLAANKKTPHIWIVPDWRSGRRERAHAHRRSGWRPSALGAGWEAVCVPLEQRRRIAGLDCRFRWRGGNSHRRPQADFDRNRSRRRTLVAGWQEHSLHLGCLSRMRRRARRRSSMQCEEAEGSRGVESQSADLRPPALSPLERLQAGKRTHIFRGSQQSMPGDQRAPLAVALPRDLTPGDYDAPEFSLGGQDDYAFSPDGQEICYTSNHDKVEATSTNNDLWIVPVKWRHAGLSKPRTSPPTIPPATRRRSIRPMASTSPTAPSSVRDTRATASG